MRTSLLIAAVSVALLAAACGKKNDASESTLGDAISANMKTNRGLLCLNRSGRGPFTFPSAYSNRDLNEYSAAALREQLAALEKSGLVARAAAAASNASARQDGIAYSLTGEGQKYAVETVRQAGDPNATADSRVSMICYAHVKLDKVTAWTEPDPATHRSEVTYTYKLDNVAPWADDRDIKRAFSDLTAADREAGETKLHVTLEQRQDGWVRVD
ncbi:hypothetical protein P9239_03175 [Caballeronia sp. LZ062]|uniref:hypothetical protein n=1 Tax=unclassified Caballeronia TaxID=2646786 RepID=UPI002863BD37|nr:MULTISPECIES: hypothetical protein [unclassified Caballeronia]MDR5857812.1 hypothetical protein [Caballeronia sp. LZ050]MDR5869361.1 hypothetical protein [Caballeronia sp. LZ062]